MRVKLVFFDFFVQLWDVLGQGLELRLGLQLDNFVILISFFTFGPPFNGTEKAPTGTGVGRGRGSAKGWELGSSCDSSEPYGTFMDILLFTSHIFCSHYTFTKVFNLFSNANH